MRTLRQLSLITTVLIGAACSESPTGPVAPKSIAPTTPDNSVITPLLLPPGATWGVYFQSFNTDRSLTLDAIHYANGASSGGGSFYVPRVGGGLLHVTRVVGGNRCLPEGTGTPCDPNHNVGVPEDATVYGYAVSANRIVRPFKVDMHSNFWPNPTNTFDTATLYFCDPTYSACTFVSNFYGELHHEPQ